MTVPSVGEIRTLGVTGGIGSGKSALCACLRDLGAKIFEADQVARDLMESSRQVRKAVIQEFGPGSYHPDGSLNRPWLAGQVFRDEVRLEKLNAIVHPQVADAFDQRKREGLRGLLVHEAALIYEAKLEGRFDAVCVVSASSEIRKVRVIKRDGMSKDAIRERMRRQLPRKELERRADVVLVNEGDEQDLYRKAERLYGLAMSGAGLGPENFRLFRRL